MTSNDIIVAIYSDLNLTFDKHIQHEINVFHLDQIIIWINGASFSLILPHNERNDKLACLYTSVLAGLKMEAGGREV